MLNGAFLLKIALTLQFAFGMGYLGRAGMADFLRIASCVYIESVLDGTGRLDPVLLDRSRERLQLARLWDGENPNIREYLGKSDLLVAQLIRFSPELRARYLRQAIAHLDAAILLRPGSGQLWAARMTAGASLLRTGLEQAECRRETAAVATALRRAVALAPRVETVLKQVLDVGQIQGWSADERAIVESVRQRSVGL